MEEQILNTNELELKLENFEGPLDLLLHLVKEAKIEIKDIFISQVTDQFLVYMNQLSSIDVDKASEYMAIAATLMEIKSHSLLPVMEEEEADASPEQEFIRNLEEYKKFKEISQKLKDIETVDRLYKPEDNSNKNVRFVAKDMSLDNLLDAFAKLLHKVGQKGADDGAKHIERDQFNVQDKIIFGSAYPFWDMKKAVEVYSTVLKPEVLPKVMGINALYALNLEYLLPEDAPSRMWDLSTEAPKNARDILFENHII